MTDTAHPGTGHPTIASSPSRPFASRSPRSTTWPTTASPASSTSPTGWASRCSSRAPPAPARPSSPSRWPRSAGARLIRLQCYEGLDESKALYEWNYKKQLLRIQAERNDGATWSEVEDDIFSDEFLLTRPLLEAIRAEEPVVLLIDEVDRVEVETEALLLEILSDYQVSIPELGTVTARQVPLVFLTSNNTRELSEALKRRCLFLHVDYPDLEREREIVLAKVPGITESLADQVARIVRSIRQLELKKPPSVSETLDWARTLLLLGRRAGRCGHRRRHGQHPAQVPERHRQGHQGARAGRLARRRGRRRCRGQALAAQWLIRARPAGDPPTNGSALRAVRPGSPPTNGDGAAEAGITAGRHRERAGAGAAAGTEGRRQGAADERPGRAAAASTRPPQRLAEAGAGLALTELLSGSSSSCARPGCRSA